MGEKQVLDLILALISMVGLAVKAYPEVAKVLRGVLDGTIDPASVRVEDLLPAESASRKAQHDLGG
jgi:hypothetical protein